MSIRPTVLAISSIAVAIMQFGPGVVPTRAQSKQHARLSADLEQVASELSAALEDRESRTFIAGQVTGSPRKNVICLADCVGDALKMKEKGDERLFGVAALIQQAEATMKECGGAGRRLEIKLPVAAHRDVVGRSDTVYVAVTPLADESEVKSITAYSKGEKISLSADEPPRVPTFVIAAAESESSEPTYPLQVSETEKDEQNKERVVDDFIGIANIWINNDHEPWYKGDPEIYVRVIRFRFSPFGTITNTVDLPGVNGEQVWHDIGDPNGTYRYVDTRNYSPTIQFQVREADWPDSDDHLGTRTVTWTGLPFGGYTTFTAGDARIRVDRD
jgi:hypothetical protein